MKDGTKIRICDMSDTHLLHTMRMLQRYAKRKCNDLIMQGFQAMDFLTGDGAQMAIEDETQALMAYGLDPEDACPLYEDLEREALRRAILHMMDDVIEQRKHA